MPPFGRRYEGRRDDDRRDDRGCKVQKVILATYLKLVAV